MKNLSINEPQQMHKNCTIVFANVRTDVINTCATFTPVYSLVLRTLVC